MSHEGSASVCNRLNSITVNVLNGSESVYPGLSKMTLTAAHSNLNKCISILFNLIKAKHKPKFSCVGFCDGNYSF